MNRDTLAEQPLAEPLATWHRLIDAMLDAVWLVDAGTLRVVAANHAAGELMAMTPGELVGKDVLELAATPEDLCFWGEVSQGLVDQIESATLVMSADGATKAVMRRVSRVQGAGVTQKGALFVVVLHDCSEQLKTERALETAAADLRATLESTHDGILVTDLAGRIRNFNQRFASLWQIPPELLTRSEDDRVLDWMRRAVVEPAAYMRRLAALDDATLLQASDVLRLRSGKVFERMTMPQCMRGRPIGRIYAFRDITEQLEANQRIETLSSTDALTGLPNRRLFADRVEVALAQSKRDGKPFALLFVKLDRFNQINETLGRVFGDRVLLDVANRMRGCVREVDTVARLTGDEFVVLANGVDEPGAETAARRVMDALKLPFTRGAMSVTVTASLGISIYPTDGAGMDELMRRADAAMRDAKLASRAALGFHRARPDGVDKH